MQAAALEVLHFLDGLEASRRRRDMVLSSAVASGVITAIQAWPEFFEGTDDDGDPGAFPSRDADMSAFQLEKATPQTYAADIEALVRASRQVTLREEDLPVPPQLSGGLPDIQWP